MRSFIQALAEAVRSVPAESRGLAMGIYTVCLDLAMGLGSPVLGLVAGWSGLGSVFLVSALIVLSAAIIPLRLMRLTKPDFLSSSLWSLRLARSSRKRSISGLSPKRR